jgi:epoxyqueuosine reductase
VKFAQSNRVLAFEPREVLASNDARTIAREVLALSQAEFSAAFKSSPIKRAKLRGLNRNAAAVLGDVGGADDSDALIRALEDDDQLVREHAAWALARTQSRTDPKR